MHLHVRCDELYQAELRHREGCPSAAPAYPTSITRHKTPRPANTSWHLRIAISQSRMRHSGIEAAASK
jgi:hypothetical protein